MGEVDREGEGEDDGVRDVVVEEEGEGERVTNGVSVGKGVKELGEDPLRLPLPLPVPLTGVGVSVLEVHGEWE